MASPQQVFRFLHPTYGLHEIAVFWSESRVYAMQGSCPHQGANLAYGRTSGGAVICPLHHATFDLDSGQCIDGFTDDAIVYEALISDGRVLIMAPGEIPAP